MSYPDYLRREIRQNEKDAALFASVGLNWLAGIAARKAKTLRESRINTKNNKAS